MKSSNKKDKTTFVLAGTGEKDYRKLQGAFRKDYKGREITLSFRKGKIAPTHIRTSKSAYTLIKKIIGKDMEIQEHFVVLYLGASQNLIGYLDHTRGTTNKVLVDLKIITGIALKALAEMVIVAHNHPGERKRHSEADIAMTEALKNGCDYFNIKLIDHLILTSSGYYSLADEGHPSLDGLNGKEEDELVQKLRMEILEGLKKITRANSPHIWAAIHKADGSLNERGYQQIEDRLIQRIISGQLTPSAAIPQLEQELDLM